MNTPPAMPFRIWSFGGLAAALILLCFPVIFYSRTGNYVFDESTYHLPAIRQIRKHWPKLDLAADSFSATAPGYQYALAGVSLLITDNLVALRLVNFAVSLAVLGLLWQARPAGIPAHVVCLALVPLLASNFFVKSACYVVTDNAALCATTGTLTALFFRAPKPRLGLASGLATAGVFIRQSGIWLLAPLGLSILQTPDQRRRLWLVLPPLGVLLCLVLVWGGLVPPAWQKVHTGFVPAAGAYLLAVCALLGWAYYAAVCAREWKSDLLRGWALAGSLGGLGVALAGATTFAPDDGRWGGYLWDVAAHLPALGRYSPVFLILTPLGGTLLAMMTRRLWLEAGSTVALAWLAAFGAWAITALANRIVFHRYYEPVMLVLLICWLLLLLRARPGPAVLLTRPLVLLGGVQLLLTVVTIYGRAFGFL